MNIAAILYEVSVWVLPVLFAITLHEAAHGWAAWRLGDDTAKRMGRVTFNPLRHVDKFGTILLPAMLLLASNGSMAFGFAKPVPVNFWRLRHPRRDMVLVAAAGPATNLVLAFVSVALIAWLVPALPGNAAEWVATNARHSAIFNMVLCCFNLLPIPPLDGGRIAVGVLPRVLAEPMARLERLGIVIVLGFVFVLPWIGDILGMRLDVFRWVVGTPAIFMLEQIVNLFGAW